MQISVVVDGTEHSISPTAGDLVRLERQYGISAASLNDANVTVEHVLFIAYSALKRTEVVDVEFEEFIDLADVPSEVPLDPPRPLPQT